MKKTTKVAATKKTTCSCNGCGQCHREGVKCAGCCTHLLPTPVAGCDMNYHAVMKGILGGKPPELVRYFEVYSDKVYYVMDNLTKVADKWKPADKNTADQIRSLIRNATSVSYYNKVLALLSEECNDSTDVVIIIGVTLYWFDLMFGQTYKFKFKLGRCDDNRVMVVPH